MSVFSPEGAPKPESQEREPKPATIRLELFRHDKKTVDAIEGPRGKGAVIRLTEKGRADATEAGKLKSPHLETSISYGSLRDRAQETALRHMLADDERVSNDMSLEDDKGVNW